MNPLSLKPYPAYKDSGVPWLGEVPGHWDVRRAKTQLAPIDVRSESGSEELLTVSSNLGVIPRHSANVTMFKAESYVGYKLCWPGDLVINSLWAWARGLGVSRYHGIISTAYGVYRKRINAGLEPWFLHELVRSELFHWELRVRSKGIWTSRLQLTDEAFLDAPIVLPPLPEQTAIVRFLDWADRRIRRAIRARKRRIELLEEYKQALIHQAVTGRIDVRTGKPYPGYKDSGIEWLGRVPEHWEELPLKRIATFDNSGSYGTEPEAGQVVKPVATTAQIDPDGSFSVGKMPLRGFTEEEVERYCCTPWDILVVKSSGSISNVVSGKAGIVWPGTPSFVFSNFLMRVIAKADSVTPLYLYHILSGWLTRERVKRMVSGTTYPNLRVHEYISSLLPVPPVPEQTAIVEYLDTQTAKIDAAVAADRRVIELLEEFRTRLVADVVTGKLDVREAAARLPKEHADDEPEALAAPEGESGEVSPEEVAV